MQNVIARKNIPFEYKNYEQRKQIAATYEFARTNYIWNQKHFNSILLNGKMMEIVEKLAPQNRADFEQKYIAYRQNHPEQFRESFLFQNVIDVFAKVAGLTEENAFWYQYIRVIDKTYDGYVHEQESMRKIDNLLRALYPDREYIVSHASGFYDAKLRIDVRIFQKVNGQIQEVCGIQLKPKSYFMSNRAWAQAAHRQNYFGQIQYVQRTHCPVYYWTYEDLDQNKNPLLYLDSNGNTYPIYQVYQKEACC